jgi:hypothetical protein
VSGHTFEGRSGAYTRRACRFAAEQIATLDQQKQKLVADMSEMKKAHAAREEKQSAQLAEMHEALAEKEARALACLEKARQPRTYESPAAAHMQKPGSRAHAKARQPRTCESPAAAHMQKPGSRAHAKARQPRTLLLHIPHGPTADHARSVCAVGMGRRKARSDCAPRVVMCGASSSDSADSRSR